jgi:hypothetical protein
MERFILVLIIILCFSTKANSQNYLNLSYQLDTINLDQPRTVFYSFVEKNDTVYIMAERWEKINNVFYFRNSLLTLDETGIEVNEIEDNTFIRFGSLASVSDSILAFVSTDYSDDLILLRYSTIEHIFEKDTFSFSTSNVGLEGRNIIKDNDNKYIILGKKFDYNHNIYSEYVIKTDDNGNEIWRREYVLPIYQNYNSEPATIFETADNNYIAVQTIERYSNPSSPNYEQRVSIEKIDTAGNQIWEYKTPDTRFIWAYDGVPTADDGVIICGTEGTQVWAGMRNRGYIRKVDSTQNGIWELQLGNSENSILNDVIALEDGNFLATGYDVLTYPDSMSINDADSSKGMGWLVKFSTNGEILWQRHYNKYNPIELIYKLNETKELANGDLLSVGHAYTHISANYRYEGWLIRTDSLGCIVPGCELLDNTENIKLLFDNEVTVFPNPIAIGSASEVVNFRFDKVINEKAVIRVYSGLGQLIGEAAIHHSDIAQMRVSDWQSGMYFYGVYVENQLVKQGQILVEH